MAEVRNDTVFPSNTMVPTEGRNTQPEESDRPMTVGVEGEKKTRKRGLGRRLSDTLFAGDRATVKDYVIFDVLIPAFKDTVSDMIANSIDILFNGSPGSRRSRGSRFNSSIRTDYSSASMSRVRSLAQKRASEVSQGRMRGMDFEDVLMYKDEAYDTLSYLRDRTDEYGYASLADYYSYTGKSYDFTMQKWGWDEDDLYSVHPKRAGRDGNGQELWFLPLPRLSYKG